jgi:hypothetical protein
MGSGGALRAKSPDHGVTKQWRGAAGECNAAANELRFDDDERHAAGTNSHVTDRERSAAAGKWRAPISEWDEAGLVVHGGTRVGNASRVDAVRRR